MKQKAYKENVQRTDGIKKISVCISDGTHAELLLKLRYDCLKQKTFFKIILESYLKDDEDFKFFINKKIEEKISKRSKKIREKDQKHLEKTINDFGLNDMEIENIFDILEKENSDL